MRLVGAARSVAELVFAAGLVPCAGCRSHDLGALELVDVDDALVLTGACPRCRRARELRFDREPDPRRAPAPGRLELGGADPSRLIRPVQLVEEIDRLAALIVWEPDGLAPGAWQVNAQRMDRVATCLVELLKFVPADGTGIPDAVLDAAGRADRAARPERYERAWLVAERDRYLALVERSIAAAERVWGSGSG